jgi:phospholipid transport system substrate-binding protein
MLRAFKVTWLVVGFVLTGNLSVVQAQTTTQPAEATKFVEALTERVSVVLARYEQGSESDRQALTQLAEEAFALDVVSRFVLGPTWQQASPAQQQEFQRVFSQWMVGVYGRRLGASKGGALKVAGTDTIANGDALVKMLATQSDGKTVDLALRVRDVRGEMKIIDVIAAGVSMATTQRQEFASIINNQGIDGLMTSLRAKAASAEAG